MELVFTEPSSALLVGTTGRGVPIGRDGDGERSGFPDFSLRATKCQASTFTCPLRSVPNWAMSWLRLCGPTRPLNPDRFQSAL